MYYGLARRHHTITPEQVTPEPTVATVAESGPDASKFLNSLINKLI